MKFRSFLLTGCLFTVVLATAAGAQTARPSAAAAASAPVKIALINIQEAILTTQEGKKLDAAMQARFQPRRVELENDQKAITALQNQLKAGGNTMSQTAKANLTEEITSKSRDFQQSVTNAQTDYQTAQTNLMNTVGNQLMPILKTYAQQHGYTAVFDTSLSWPQSPVLYFSPSAEITSQIVKLYDQAHPVAASTAAAPAPAAK